MRLAAGIALALLAAGCAGPDDAPAGATAEVAIEVGAYTVKGVSRAIYAVEVRNAKDVLVSDLIIDTDDPLFEGDDPAVVRFAGKCDSRDNPNRITVTMTAAWIGPEPTPLHPSALPPAQSKEFWCERDFVSELTFSFDVIGPAGAGFFDLTLGTTAVHCSARLGCTDNSDGSVASLPASTDARFLLAFACRIGPDTTPALHLDDLVVDCGPGPVAIIDPSQSGHVPPERVTDPAQLVDHATIFRGEQAPDAAGRQLYWNVSIGLRAAAREHACTLRARGTVSDRGVLTVGAPWVAWEVPLTDGTSELACGAHTIFDDSGRIAPAWPEPGETPAFDHVYHGD